LHKVLQWCQEVVFYQGRTENILYLFFSPNIKLILQAPYYSLADAIHHLAPSLDTTGLPFVFNTYQFLPNVTCPIIIFHGDADKEFYYGSSQKLKVFFKPSDELVTLPGAGHTKMEDNKEYLGSLKRVL
jgi:hypothetical protein